MNVKLNVTHRDVGATLSWGGITALSWGAPKRADLKSLGIGVSNDLTYNQRQELKKHKEKGHSAYYKNGVLHVDEGPAHHHNQNKDRLYSEVTASSSLTAERPTQARKIARPPRRIKGATQHSERKESARQQQQQQLENRRSTEPNKQDRRMGPSAIRSNLNQNSDNTDCTIVTPKS
ncbi:hypothetical protein ElyMa_006222600 [Elysia marginata]|uniref:Uncharacterized protein n=1 Tax=Elysia marginata TaxID=1093978 RepID=A0AAV4H878_9GAST|nr:hypothetical protein ElyMa_006222600 [Elysia marginata]